MGILKAVDPLTVLFFLLAVTTAVVAAVRSRTDTNMISLAMACLSFAAMLIDQDLAENGSQFLLIAAGNTILTIIAAWRFMFEGRK